MGEVSGYRFTRTAERRDKRRGGRDRGRAQIKTRGDAHFAPDAYIRVHSAAVRCAAASSRFHASATPLSKGSSGFGALSSAWIDNKTVRICKAGDHLSLRMSRQMRPNLSTFGW